MKTKGILVAISNFIGALKAFFHIGKAWKRGRNDDRIMRETNKHAQRGLWHKKIYRTSGAFGSVKKSGRKLARKFGRGIDVRAFRNAAA